MNTSRSLLVVATATLLACSKEPARAEKVATTTAASATASSHPAATPAPSVHVDPSLVSTGRITMGQATRRPLRGELRVPAETVSSETGSADVGALVAGRIASIDAREGDVVKRGQLLATLDSPEAARTGADAIRARARVLAASRRLERQTALEGERATSAAAVDEARMDLETARADAAASRTLLHALGMVEPSATPDGSLSARVPLRSPIDGVLVERSTSLGAPVSPDKTLFRIVATDRVVVEARWTDPASTPAAGAAVLLLPRGGASENCAGHVIASLAIVDEKTRARRVRIAPDKPCAILAPGVFVDASFSSEGASRAPVLAVPREAVVDVRGAATVFVADGGDGGFVARVVRLGKTTSEDAAIEDGLSEGDRLAVTGAVLLKGELLRAELE